jgi:hypothetical protein
MRANNGSKVKCPAGRHSSVGIATRYVLDGPEIEYHWGAKISPPVQTVARAHPASFKWIPGRDVNYHSHIVSRLKKEDRYTSTTSGSSWPILG